MTIDNVFIGFENTYCPENVIKSAMINNEPLEEKLNVIIVVSNPCNYMRRYKLAKEFVERIEKYNSDNVNLYVVELAYDNQKYALTEPNNPNHLQLHSTTVLWHKENMINVGIKKLLPEDWKAVAWIDADIEFENLSWPIDTLKILNGSRDFVQLFSHAIDMDKDCNTMSIFSGFGYQYMHNKKYKKFGNDFWHPGFAWAFTRNAYEKLGGLYDLSILGSGDHYMALSLLQFAKLLFSKNAHYNYTDSINEYQKNALSLRLGYVPGVIKHYYHGSKKNRQYSDRYKILDSFQYDPYNHVTKNDIGLLVPTKTFPQGLKHAIMNYFQERNEDEE